MIVRLFVGLGNPGKNYNSTRHNAGYWLVDELAQSENLQWQQESRFRGWLSRLDFGTTKIFFLKPETFMNNSGESVRAVVNFYKIEIQNITVFHDELDFEPGFVRFKRNGGAAGHNGIKSIIAHLGASKFERVRLGIGRPEQNFGISNYVLHKPGGEEKKLIDGVIAKLVSDKNDLFEGAIDKLMLKFH